MSGPEGKNFFLLCLLISVFLLPGAVYAKKDVKKQYQEVQKKIKTHKEKLKQAKKLERSTLDELDKTSKELSKVEKNLRQYRRKLEETEKRVTGVRAEISVLKRKLKKRSGWVKRKLRAMYRYGRYGDVVLIMGAAENISQLIRRWKYLEVLTSHEREIIEDYKKDLTALDDRQAVLQGLLDELKAEQEKIRQANRRLTRKKEQKENILASVRKEKAAYRKMLRELEERSKKLLEFLKEAEREKYAGKGFRKLKGKLPWPVQGKLSVPYGTQKDPRFDTPVFRNGIYIAAKRGSIAKAIHSGRVVFADWFKGYGQLVIITHGEGYHTLYANLSEIFLKTGDIIKRKGKVGRVGDSGMLDKPALYFEVRYKGKPLNPVQWLRKR